MTRNINSSRFIAIHKRIIKDKSFLRRFYCDTYKYFRKICRNDSLIVEIGSGGGFLKDIIPKAVTSDVVFGPEIDRVFKAEKMPFKNSSVDTFIMFSVLHHIKDPQKAFREMERCLKPGGKILAVEPTNTLFSSLIYRMFHSEVFDPEAGWKVQGKGRLSDANLAMPWIIFIKNRRVFQQRFPKLKILNVFQHSPFIYLFSGGVSYSWVFPEYFYDFVKTIESLVVRWNRYLGMWMTIELRKSR